VKSADLCIVTLCNSEEFRCSGRIYRLHLQGQIIKSNRKRAEAQEVQWELPIVKKTVVVIISQYETTYCGVLPVNTSNNLWVADFVSRFIGYTSGDVYSHL
jgi:hypothetical protein